MKKYTGETGTSVYNLLISELEKRAKAAQETPDYKEYLQRSDQSQEKSEEEISLTVSHSFPVQVEIFSISSKDVRL